MSNDIGFSPISVAIKSNKLSKTKLHEIVPSSKIIENCKKVSIYEKDTLGLDRSNQSIGLPPSYIHACEAVSHAEQLDDVKNSYGLAIVEYIANQFELVVQLMKPSVMTLLTNPSHVFTYDYISSFGFDSVYVPNDESLFRSENIIENIECPFNVVSKNSLLNGQIPEETDLLMADAIELSSHLDIDIVPKIYASMKQGSVILLYNINDYYAYYANNDEFDENKPDHPIYDINQSIKNLDNCYYYHIGTSEGITVIIKK